MNYQDTLDFLYEALPMFQRVGSAAFKKDLSNTLLLCEHLGNPHKQFKSIHIAGTNGKGSSAHSLAAILQEAGYKTGLYTSPHLKSFTERIRINGEEISQESVVAFVAENKDFLENLRPSFFEMTVGMAFWHFAQEGVDIAVVEVGMGGRLDSTNVLQPELCLITSIGWDHMQFLGDSLVKIAGEKAGIIKKNTPVVVSQKQATCAAVFVQKAQEEQAPLVFAADSWEVEPVRDSAREGLAQAVHYLAKNQNIRLDLQFGLLGDYQRWNLPGILEVVSQLQRMGWAISNENIQSGLLRVTELTGLKGRWQILGENPWVIADTGHNEPGMQAILKQLERYAFRNLWMVLGMVQDKDLSTIIRLLPREASYIFCNSKIPRALPATDLLNLAQNQGLEGVAIPDIAEAIRYARKKASPDDLIFIGGSTFVVAEIEKL